MNTVQGVQLKSGKSSSADRAASMRLSAYTSFLDLPGKPRTFLLHGSSGALDVVPAEIAGALAAAGGEAPPPGKVFDKETTQILFERGYLTERAEADEFEYVRKVLDVFASRIKSRFVFRIPVSAAAPPSPEEVFDVIGRLYQGRANQQLATAVLDFRFAGTDEVERFSALVGAFLEQAILWETELAVEAPATLLPIFRAHIPKNYLQKLTLRLDALDEPWVAGPLVDFTVEAARLGRWVEWLVKSDGLMIEQLEWLFAQREVVRAKLPSTDTRKAQRFAIVPLVDSPEAALVAEQITAADLEGFRALFRHTGTSVIKTEAVLFVPLSVPPVADLRFEEDGRIVLSLPPWQPEIVVGNREAGDTAYTFDAELIESSIEAARQQRAGLLNQCGASCRFALMCDNHCTPAANLLSPPGRRVSEKGDYKQRLGRIAPLLIENSFGFSR